MDEVSPWERVVLTMMEEIKDLRSQVSDLRERFVELDHSVTLNYLNKFEKPQPTKETIVNICS